MLDHLLIDMRGQKLTEKEERRNKRPTNKKTTTTKKDTDKN